MFTDYVLNGQSHGEVGNALGSASYDPGFFRPWIGKDGRKYVSLRESSVMNEKGQREWKYKNVPVSELIHNGFNSPVHNALSLRKDEWIQLDMAVKKAARLRLRAVADLNANGQVYNLNGMGKTLLEHQTMSDPGEAYVDMDGRSEGTTDRPLFQLEGLPLPITHVDFHIAKRTLDISRNSGESFDTILAEAAGQRIGETIEKTLIGTQTGMTFGTASNYGRTPTVYGYTNFTDRVTKTNMTAPDGTNGPTVLTDWLALRELMYAQNFYGPFMAYVSTDWDQYLDNLFSTSEPSAGTLRTRLMEIGEIQGIRRLDHLTDTFTVILVQMTSNVVRMVNGLDVVTIQWESKGGMQLNFKVMTIQVPQMFADYNGNCGIGHATTS